MSTAIPSHRRFYGPRPTAWIEQSSRGADLLIPSLANYLIKSPQDVRYAMTAQVCGQPAHDI